LKDKIAFLKQSLKDDIPSLPTEITKLKQAETKLNEENRNFKDQIITEFGAFQIGN
jgi:cell division protein FtsB